MVVKSNVQEHEVQNEDVPSESNDEYIDNKKQQLDDHS